MCFPFAMSGLALQQLCSESQVQSSFGLQVNLWVVTSETKTFGNFLTNQARISIYY